MQEVQKKGYELNEIGVIGRQYACSDKVPLTIVMVSSSQLQADKQRIENNAYKVAEKNYRAKLELLEKQKEDNAITEEHYRKELLDLQDKFEKYQLLIDGLAEHYAHVDYDDLNEKEREVNIYIENGELERADSLIKTMFDPIDVLKRNKEALAQLNQQISEANTIIGKANEDMAAVLKQQEKDADYLYQLYTIALSRFDNDKARFYIETRAELDTANVVWQLDASYFHQDYHADYDKAYSYGYKALQQATLQYDDSCSILGECYNCLGKIYYHKHDSETAFMYFGKAIAIAEKNINNKPELVAKYHNNLSSIYLELGEYNNALPHSVIALGLLQILGNQHLSLATTCNNIAKIYYHKGNITEAIKVQQLALKIWGDYYHNNHPYMATMYDNLGSELSRAGQYSGALECHNKGLKIRQAILNPNHPEIAINYDNIASVYIHLEDYEKARKYLNMSLSIFKQSPDNCGVEIATCYNNFGLLYCRLKQYSTSIDYYQKALSILKEDKGSRDKEAVILFNMAGVYHSANNNKDALKYLDKASEIYELLSTKDSTAVATLYNNYGMIYASLKKYSKSLDYYNKALNIYKLIYGDNHPDVATCYNNIAHLLVHQGKYQEALFYFEIALSIRLKKFPINHPLIISLKKDIKDVEIILLK
mgnify:CR=1 FL=1